ncbi:TPA_asm: hypothetical protein [Powellomyces chytrid fungus MELD virus 1]|nr:TPA_asm: hypothetical protein [Powellomyces chytrid fungus MELD virus 1]
MRKPGNTAIRDKWILYERRENGDLELQGSYKTLTEVAKVLGVGMMYLSCIVNGSRHSPLQNFYHIEKLPPLPKPVPKRKYWKANRPPTPVECL